MAKRIRVALVVMFVVLVSVIGWRVGQPSEPEPVYKGKPLSRWLLDVTATGGPEGLENAREAMRHMGTNALPTLLRMLQVKDSPLKAALVRLNYEQRIMNFRINSDVGWNHAGIVGFSILGTNAQSAVPALIEMLNQNNSRQSAIYVIGALSCIGPSAKGAVPALLRFATNADPVVRSSAAITIRQIDPEAAAKTGVR